MDKKFLEKRFDTISGNYDLGKLKSTQNIKEIKGFYKFFDIKKGDVILDVGTGTGQYLLFALKKGAKCFGIDISEKMLEVAKLKLGDKVVFEKAEASKIPFEDNKFDWITCIGMFEYNSIEEFKNILTEFKRVLKKEGRVILDFPNINHEGSYKFNLDSKLDGFNIYLYNKKRIRNVISEEGFKILKEQNVRYEIQLLLKNKEIKMTLYDKLKNHISREKWKIGIYESNLNYLYFNSKTKNPIFTSKNIKDIRTKFVADPFLIYDKKKYYLFFEVFNSNRKKGEIGLARSEDMKNWNYEKVILRRKFHLSYPMVFKWKNEFYMIPETKETNSVLLYKSLKFPYEWKYEKTLLKGNKYGDSTLFYHNKLLYLFTETNDNENLNLFYSNSLVGKWNEHPKSPIVKNNPHSARPSGNILKINSKIIRFAQDCFPSYGRNIKAFEITKLNEKEYEERELSEKGFSIKREEWNKNFMHHISSIKIGNKIIAMIDGY